MRPLLSTSRRLTDDELRVAVRGSAMKRAKIAGLRRNIEVAVENAERTVS
jgi:epoxyqueuosine reductase QueG